MTLYEVVLTRTVILDHARYESKDKKEAEKLASKHFYKADLYDSDTDMEITEVEK